MIELEAKVWLEAKRILPDQLLPKIKAKCVFIGITEKHDYYFAKKDDVNQKFIFRLRKENNQFIVTYKQHIITKGIESNKETEFIVDNYETFCQFSDYLGYKIAFTKIKQSKKFIYQDYNIELNYLEGLGHFLEIEKQINEEDNLTTEKARLLQIFNLFGFIANDLEPKRYIELFKNLS